MDHRLRTRLVIFTLGFALLLAACGDLAAALPERPTPVPTLARLPSVTPITPSPTLAPTLTPTLTPTPRPLVATVARAANVRGGPGTDYAIVGVIEAGVTVTLRSRRDDWFAIETPDVTGWMFRDLLELTAEIERAVPVALP
ncbi:MAG: SH3 domain-containing protein [Candidatus Viridilinea halotolerans]|uniref:SH3 domain-containing protein n=1 Tax=Candidatus Viridilinea halotolerans TaxID=2491704 RepID=A0A426TQB1_9CHLR|nr:MAG: SH3 domain-containing protein [Candidatus Viridilinea halotolerans]